MATKILLGAAAFLGSLLLRIGGTDAFVLHRPCRRHLTTPEPRIRIRIRTPPPEPNGLFSFSLSTTDTVSSKGAANDGESFASELLDRLHRNDTSPIVVEGYVTSKRSIGKNLAFLDFRVDRERRRAESKSKSKSKSNTDDQNENDSENENDGDRNLCQALLRRDLYRGDFHDGYRRCLLKGCRFRLEGVPSPTRIPGNVVLTLTSMELLGLPRQPQHIQIVLEQAVAGAIPLEEVVLACAAGARERFDRDGSVGGGGGGSASNSSNSTSSSRDDNNESIRSVLEECRASLTHEAQGADLGNDNDNDDSSLTEMARRKAVSRRLKRLSKDILSALPRDPLYPVAADQRAMSKKEGNYVVPPAPREWRRVPERLSRDLGASRTSATERNSERPAPNRETTGTVRETLSEMKRMAEGGGSGGGRTPGGDASARVALTGWVQNRRRFDGNVTMIYLVDEMTNPPFEVQDPSSSPSSSSSTTTPTTTTTRGGNAMAETPFRLACLLHPDVLSHTNTKDSGVYQNLIAGGSRVRVEGRILLPPRASDGEDRGRETKPPPPMHVWVEDIALVRSSHRPVTIRHLLDLLHEKRIDPREAAGALLIPHEEAKRLSLQSDATERQWKANVLAVRLQKEFSSSGNAMGRLDPALLRVMEKYRHLSEMYPVIATGIEDEPSERGGENQSGDGTIRDDDDDDDHHRNHSVGPNANGAARGTPDSIPRSNPAAKRQRPRGMPGSKWQIKKKPQLEWMSRQIRAVLESHPDFGTRELTVLDIGGGKGQLANHLGRSLGNRVRVHVVDICPGAVRNGKKKAERLDLPVDFQFADASNSNLLDAVDADVVVALHACGHLSDVALNHAVHRRAGFVIVPCCFNSNPHLMIPESETNALTPVPEWLGLPPGDWSALKLLAEVQGNIPLASEAIGIICAIRAQAALEKMGRETKKGDGTTTSEASVSGTLGAEREITIKRFPIQYSTRNTVLVGKCS